MGRVRGGTMVRERDFRKPTTMVFFALRERFFAEREILLVSCAVHPQGLQGSHLNLSQTSA